MRFPRVEGKNLNKEQFELPRDFEGGLNVVMVAFEREHQMEVDTWVPQVKALAEEHEGLRFYELPTIREMNFLQQWFIDSGMRTGIPDRGTRAVTITLYLDVEQFARELELAGTDRIYVMLVDGEGNIRWRTEGSFTEGKGRGLAEAVRAAAAEGVSVR
jgi:hypothetical protein